MSLYHVHKKIQNFKLQKYSQNMMGYKSFLLDQVTITGIILLMTHCTAYNMSLPDNQLSSVFIAGITSFFCWGHAESWTL